MRDDLRKSYVTHALGLWALQVVLTAFGLMSTFLSAFSGDSCGPGPGLCDFDAFWAACNTFYIGSLVLLALAVVGLFVLRSRGRLALLPPVIGAVAVLALLVATYIAERAAFQLPLYGGRI
jgi:hypothetical protein